MNYTFTAIYEDGILRPLEPLPKGLLEEGEHLTGVIDYEANHIKFYRKAKDPDAEIVEVSNNN